jgi:hypothetical protein
MLNGTKNEESETIAAATTTPYFSCTAPTMNESFKAGSVREQQHVNVASAGLLFNLQSHPTAHEPALHLRAVHELNNTVLV